MIEPASRLKAIAGPVGQHVVGAMKIGAIQAKLDEILNCHPVRQYAFAGGLVLIAFLVRESLVYLLDMNLWSTFFVPAVMLAGLACGIGAAIFAAVLATFAPGIHLIENNAQFFPSDGVPLINTVLTGAINILVAFVSASHHQLYRESQNTSHVIAAAARELNHRTKNLMSVILSLANRIGQYTSDVEAFKTALSDRLHSIAATQDLLVSNRWESADINRVVKLALEPFMTEQIRVRGPRIMLPPVCIENLMMALNELLTNSAKYGALAFNGRIDIKWRVDKDVLTFIWDAEDRGKKSTATGFGFLVLTEVVPRNLGGKAVYVINDDRVFWSLEVPIATIQQTVRAAAEFA